MCNLRSIILILIALWLISPVCSAENKEELLSVKVKRLTLENSIDEMTPRWSPDGKSIAYSRRTYDNPIVKKGGWGKEYGLASIWLMDSDGSNNKRVSPEAKWEGNDDIGWTGTSYRSYPWWSPDGTRLLVEVNVRKYPDEPHNVCGDDYRAVINISTKQIEEIKEEKMFIERLIWKANKEHAIEIVKVYPDTWVALSSGTIEENLTTDSKGIFFIKEREEKVKGEDKPKIIKDLWMRQDKKENLLAKELGSDYGQRELLWSPNKKRVAFITDYHIKDKQVLYLMNADGSKLTKVEGMPKEWGIPDWSPDGTKMIFEGTDKDEWNIYQIIVEDDRNDKK